MGTIGMAKSRKTQVFARWWSCCFSGPFVNRITRSLRLLEPTKTQVLHVCLAWGRDDRGNCVPIIDCFLSKRLYCVYYCWFALPTGSAGMNLRIRRSFYIIFKAVTAAPLDYHLFHFVPLVLGVDQVLRVLQIMMSFLTAFQVSVCC